MEALDALNHPRQGQEGEPRRGWEQHRGGGDDHTPSGQGRLPDRHQPEMKGGAPGYGAPPNRGTQDAPLTGWQGSWTSRCALYEIASFPAGIHEVLKHFLSFLTLTVSTVLGSAGKEPCFLGGRVTGQ